MEHRANFGRRARTGLTGAGVLLLALLPTGCERRAPGPDECHDVAVRLSSVAPQRLVRRQHNRFFIVPADPDSDPDVMDRTTECLTVPYDRELVRCIEAGASATLCFRSFRARHQGSPLAS